MQIAADHRLRLIPLGHRDAADLAVAANVRVVADEVDEVRAEREQLRHDRVVVVLLRHVTVAAGFRLGLALGVRIVRVECLRAVTACGDRRLLHVDALATRVRRRQHQCRGRTHRRDLAAGRRLAAAEQEHLVARDLRVVRRVIARLAAFVVMPLGLGVCFDRQMAARAARRPGRVAGVALHVLIRVRHVLGLDVLAPFERRGIAAHQLGARRLLVVLGAERIDRVLHDAHLPFEVRIHHRALVERVADPFETPPAVRRAQRRHVRAAAERRGAGGIEVRHLLRRAVAVLARDLDRRSDFAIDVAVAVVVLRVVTVDALHADVDVNR